jgi:hypothetical protein
MPAIAVPSTNREAVAESIRKYILACIPGKVLSVTVEPFKKERTPAACRYFNGVAIKLLCEHTGYENEDMREYLNGGFFGWKTVKVPGNRTKEVPVRTTTTNEDGKRDVIAGETFWKMVAWVQRVGANAGVYIPDPDPQYYLGREKWSDAA